MTGFSFRRADPAAGIPPLLMGVINVTPDSFSDGGDASTLETALQRAEDLIAEGADIIDIGGESTRPGASEITADDELARVLPVIMALRLAHPYIPISIDTYKARVAAAAVEAGATLINDVWGLSRDPDMARVAAESDAPLIVMHWEPSRPPDEHLPDGIRRFFGTAIDRALSAGVAEDAICLDPGLGFAKTQIENYEILEGLPSLRVADGPILIGASRKSFIGRATGREAPKDRLSGTLAFHQLAVLNGADILRVHDIAPHRDMLNVVIAAKTGRLP